MIIMKKRFLYQQMENIIKFYYQRLKYRFIVPYYCHALLDSGSQTNFITKDLVEKLELKEFSTKRLVYGINNADGRFVVKIPLKLSPSLLGDSKRMALKRLFNLKI